MELVKYYKIVCRKKPMHKKGSAVLALFDTIPAGSQVPIKAVLGETKVLGEYPLYLEMEGRDNIFASLQSLTDEDGKPVPVENVTGAEYKIVLNKREGFEMSGYVEVRENVAMAPGGKQGSKVDPEIEAMVQEKIKTGSLRDINGPVTYDGAMERIKYMIDNYVDLYVMRSTIRKFWDHFGYKRAAHVPKTKFVDPFLEQAKKAGSEGLISQGLRNAVAGYPMILQGDKSVGKNVYAETLAWLLMMPFDEQTASREMTEGQWLGDKTTDNTAAEELAKVDPNIIAEADMVRQNIAARQNLVRDPAFMSSIAAVAKDEKGVQSFIDSLLAIRPEEKQALEREAEVKLLQSRAASVVVKTEPTGLTNFIKDGGFFCVNEINLGEANTMTKVFNPLLDRTGFYYIPGEGTVKVNKKFILFATQNIDYVGIEDQNPALLSRFGAIDFMQPDSVTGQLKAAVLTEMREHGYESADIDMVKLDETVALVNKMYKQYLKAIRNGSTTNQVLNIRGMVRAVTLYLEGHGFASLNTHMKAHIVNLCTPTEKMALSAILDSMIPR